MDRAHSKSRKNKTPRYGEKDKPPSLHQDLKTIKENLKIKEMLKIVKINSSFRLKGPRGTKVITDNLSDIADNNLILESSTRDNVVDAHSVNEAHETGSYSDNDSVIEQMYTNSGEDNDCENYEVIHPDPDEGDSSQVNPSNDSENENPAESKVESSGAADHTQAQPPIPEAVISEHSERDVTSTLPRVKSQLSCERNRKMSLDQTILRRESWSQSELDLHSVGKSPLERKSSFFRKKLDNFFKNTSEIFKRQSSSVKTEKISRKGSMSFSLQSLNEKSLFPSEMVLQTETEDSKSGDSINNLDMPSNLVCSASSLPGSEISQRSFLDSQISLVESQSSHPSYGDTQSSQSNFSTNQPFTDVASSSMNSLNDLNDPLAASRAYSVSSGLDTVHKPRSRRLASRTNRITWLANEGLAEYMRRRVEIEINRKANNISSSYQDVNYVPEAQLTTGSMTRLDAKGRRLSYQRAVSGEDPVMPHRLSDRRRNRYSPEAEANQELANRLAEFTRVGVPALKGFHIAIIPDTAFDYLRWAEEPERVEQTLECKKLGANEEARQAVIRELVVTEADYIKHLLAIVEVFMAAAHALQDGGLLLEIDTERLFSNTPDVLNASLYFWEAAIYPMLSDAIENDVPLNTEYMYPGFYRFRELFQPYEKYVSEQSKALDYLRSLASNTDFMAYLTWCHSHKRCNRLQLSDMMVKPMQRLTKYSILLRRIIAHTDVEPERTTLIAMESFAKNYVLDLNRTIRQKEEIEKLDNLIETLDYYEIDFKDEEMDRLFRFYANINLKAPMVGCLPSHSRTLVYQGDLRFKDNLKETRIDVRAILLTDMLLICKKLSPKTSSYPYKLIRPKYMVDKMMHFPQYKTGKKEIASIVFVMIDEVGTAYHCFALSEPAKDSNPNTMKIWEQKIREAKMTYELGVWFAKNPSRDLSELDIDTSSDFAARPGPKQNSEDLSIEREARERVAAMLHRCMGASTDYDLSQGSMTTDSFDGEASGTSGGKTPGMPGLRHPMHRNSTGGSSRNSRLSSFQQSTSAASHDEPQAGPSRYTYRCGSSVEHVIPPQNPQDDVTSITVNVLSESESETIVPKQLSPQKSGSGSRSPSASHQHTLKVQPHSGVMALVHSLPDLTIEPSPKLADTPKTPSTQSPSPQTASEKLYQSHQELLNRNRLSARPHSTHLLSPDHRGTSYPPPSPTRASLKRGLAFSYSIKNPPLAKMGHVNSQQLQIDVPSTSQFSKIEKGAINPLLVGSASGTTSDKKSAKHFAASSGGWHGKSEG